MNLSDGDGDGDGDEDDWNEMQYDQIELNVRVAMVSFGCGHLFM